MMPDHSKARVNDVAAGNIWQALSSGEVAVVDPGGGLHVWRASYPTAGATATAGGLFTTSLNRR
jgi:hypothetical protein